MKVLIQDDSSSEMILIEVDGKCLGFGNYWDLDTKDVVVSLCKALKVDYEIDDNWKYEEEE